MQLALFAGNNDIKLFSLYPVPLVTPRLTVKMNQTSVEVSAFELRNLIGKKLQEKKLPKSAEEVVFEEMDTYPNGIYIILAKDAFGKIIETSKFTIDR